MDRSIRPGLKLLTVADALAALQKLHARKLVYWRYIFDAQKLGSAGDLRQKLAEPELDEPLSYALVALLSGASPQ